MNVCSTLPLTPRFRLLARVTLQLVLLLVFAAAPAWAQLSRVGSITALPVGSGTVKGTDSSWDPVNQVYLVVSAYGVHHGIFVNRFGIPVTGPFLIKSGSSHFPRARYSPNLGGFLVTWAQEDGPGQHSLHTRTVAYPGILQIAAIAKCLC